MPLPKWMCIIHISDITYCFHVCVTHNYDHTHVLHAILPRQTSTILKQKSVTSEAGSRPGSTTGSSSRLDQVSAGELLGRTHEELVLLLIQLRRQSAAIYKAMETCHMEIEAQVLISVSFCLPVFFLSMFFFFMAIAEDLRKTERVDLWN